MHSALPTEVRLAKDVYSPDEGIDCTLLLHQDSREPLDVRKIKAKLTQHVVVANGGKILSMSSFGMMCVTRRSVCWHEGSSGGCHHMLSLGRLQRNVVGDVFRECVMSGLRQVIGINRQGLVRSSSKWCRARAPSLSSRYSSTLGDNGVRE